MLPCKLGLGAGGTVTSVEYATAATAAACAGQFSLSYQPVYAGTPNAPGPAQTLALPPRGVQVMSCGAAVARSRGALPADTCARIGAQLAQQANITAPIGDDTALYILDPACVLPTFVGEAGPPPAGAGQLHKDFLECCLAPAPP